MHFLTTSRPPQLSRNSAKSGIDLFLEDENPPSSQMIFQRPNISEGTSPYQRIRGSSAVIGGLQQRNQK